MVRHLDATITSALILTTIITGALASSVRVGAENVTDITDTASVTVPASCSMTATLESEHSASIPNGIYSGSSDYFPNGIGKTKIATFCNDNNGYAIYAIGFTDDKYDGEDHTKLIGATNGQKITTSTATSGDTSSWAMKLIKETDDTKSYNPTALTIENGYDNYNVIPNTYTKVANYTSTTDQTLGSVLSTTYAAYISPTQVADTYTGKVKYTLVHPSTSPAPVGEGKVGVNYIGNGKTFAGGASENRVVYAMSPMYVATTPEIAKSENVASDGTKNNAYGSDAKVTVHTTSTGASKMKVVIDYGLSAGTGLVVVPEYWNGDGIPSRYEMISDGNNNASGAATYVFKGDSITMYMENFGASAPVADYDYGFWARVYPVYATEQEGAELSDEFVTFTTDTGTYATTTDWYGSWYADINNTHYDFLDESEVKNFLESNLAALNGTTVNLYRGLTFTEAYTRANKSQDGGYYKQQELTKSMCNTIAVTQNQTLKDIRDSNTYMAGKLKDGNCWMLDNLALDPTDATTAANMSASNTNATSAAINNLLHGGSTTTGWSNIAVADVDEYFSSFTEPRINNASKDTLVTSYGPASINGQAKVGIYYNYCAASASTYCYESGHGIDTDQDLCPANWRMPTEWGGEYQNLVGKYTTSDATATDSLQYNLSTPLSGVFLDVLASDQGNSGNFWSSSFDDEGRMNYLYVESDGAYIGYDNRNHGHSLRCLVGS